MATRKTTAHAGRGESPAAKASAPLLYSTTRAPRTLDRTPARAQAEPLPEKGGERPASVRQRFGELRGLLADGWEIVQPIFARPLWSTPDNSATAFSFVLRREDATRLLTVPEGRTVQRFIRERNLLVDYRS